MNSTLLNQMGIGNLDPGIYVIALAVALILLLVAIILLAVQIGKTKKLKNRLDKFMIGKSGDSLEDLIVTLCEDNKDLKAKVDNNRKDIRTLYRRLESAYQKIGLVKYDAFNQMGGQLSFCLALLNERDDGFIINSVHSAEGCYSYTKEIRGGICSISLGQEEEEALEIAMGDIKV